MSKTEYVTAAETAAVLDIPRRDVVRLVERGALVPAMKLPGRTGAFLFDATAVDALAEERAR